MIRVAFLGACVVLALAAQPAQPTHAQEPFYKGKRLTFLVNYAPGGKDAHGYSHTRYANEYDRCLGVLERRLAERTWLVGEDYSIADMICWPWVLIAKPLGGSLEPYANVSRWRTAVKDRPAVQRGVDLGKEFRRNAPPTDAERKVLFGQRGSGAAEG